MKSMYNIAIHLSRRHDLSTKLSFLCGQVMASVIPHTYPKLLSGVN